MNPEIKKDEKKLQRSLKSRHLNMIAIGGAIGTGLFVALGDSLSTAGPGGALAAYAIIGIMVYFL
ncbi:MAG: gamma-aminobutyrate permease, partial [Anaerovorax sp.]